MNVSEGPGGDEGREEVGSLGEEATRLLGSLAAWAREHGSELGQGVEDLTDHVSESLHDMDAHLATGSAECTVCPLCRAVHAVRGLSPEVRSHLSSATTSLLQAALAMMATATPTTGTGSSPDAEHADRRHRKAPVEHIDLEDNWPDPTGERGVE